MGRRVQAVAGVNGGYFAPSGDPVGVLAMDGQLLSEPVDGRSALIVATRPASRALRRRAGSLPRQRHRERPAAGDRRRGPHPRPDTGLRRPWRRPADDAAERGAHLHATRASSCCSRPRYGARPPREGGVEAVLRDGRVASVRAPGSGRVPRDGLLLTGTGDAARFLRAAALPRSPAEVTLRLTAAGSRSRSRCRRGPTAEPASSSAAVRACFAPAGWP